jgi:tetratricopeptide (TPR) repeat protein
MEKCLVVQSKPVHDGLKSYVSQLQIAREDKPFESETNETDESAETEHESAQSVSPQIHSKKQRTCFPTTAKAVILNNIGVARFIQNKYDDALRFCLQSLRTAEIPGTSPIRADIRENIGLTFMSVGKEKEAIKWFRTAIDLMVECAGREHVKVVQIRRNLAKAFVKMGDLAHAMTQLEECLRVYSTVHGQANPAAIEIMGEIAWIKYTLGRHTEALRGYEIIIALRNQSGENDLDARFRRSIVLQSLGHSSEALKALRYTWTRFQQGGCQDIGLGASISKWIGILWSQRGRDLSALKSLMQAWRLERQCFGTSMHPDVANTIGNMAVVYCRLDEVSKSARLSQISLQIRERCGVARDEGSSALHHNLALALSNLKEGRFQWGEVAYHYRKSNCLYLELFAIESEKAKRIRELLHAFQKPRRTARNAKLVLERSRRGGTHGRLRRRTWRGTHNVLF